MPFNKQINYTTAFTVLFLLLLSTINFRAKANSGGDDDEITINSDSLKSYLGKVSIYPNPATSKFYIQIDGLNGDDDDDDGDTYVYSIGNIFGKRKKTGTVKKKSEGGTQVIEIDISDLSTGAYIITISIGGKNSILKLIVQ